MLRCSSVNGENFRIESYSSCNAFSNFYLGGTTSSALQGQLYLHGCVNSQWNNIRIDSTQTNGVKLDEASIQNIFNGLHITCGNYPADNTKDALLLDGDADFNVFNGFYIGKKSQAESVDWRYGVNELTSDYNTYSSGVIRNCQTGRTTGLGGNTKWDTSSIIED